MNLETIPYLYKKTITDSCTLFSGNWYNIAIQKVYTWEVSLLWLIFPHKLQPLQLDNILLLWWHEVLSVFKNIIWQKVTIEKKVTKTEKSFFASSMWKTPKKRKQWVFLWVVRESDSMKNLTKSEFMPGSPTLGVKHFLTKSTLYPRGLESDTYGWRWRSICHSTTTFVGVYS